MVTLDRGITTTTKLELELEQRGARAGLRKCHGGFPLRIWFTASDRGRDLQGNALALRHSYVYHVLKFLRNGQARTANDLLRLIEMERENMRLEEGKWLAGPKTVEEMEQVLAGLKEIGAVPIGGDNDVSPDDDPPLSSFHGEGGDGGSPGGPASPEGGDGGAGLSEILGHAVLFCLSDDAQEALLDTALSLRPLDQGVQG